MSTSCNNTVDYSTVSGKRILPFQFTLNMDKSILYPDAGEKQKFYYDIIAVGDNSPKFADLSHFLLGICSNIEKEDISNVSVVLNGTTVTPVWGKDIEIKTPEHPDNPTGCVGLKFNYPLNKINGTMSVSFTLATAYPVGPVNVCIFGGNTTANGLSICGPVCSSETPCNSVFYQNETVCVPVTVTPFAHSENARALCCGRPTINNTASSCPGTKTSCSFTITQRLCIEIPIEFGAHIVTGDAVVSCGNASTTPCNCSSDESTETEENGFNTYDKSYQDNSHSYKFFK